MILLPHFVQLPEFKKLIFNNNHKYSKGEIMPLDIAYPNNGEGIEVRALGHINSNEILQVYNEIYSEESIKKRKYFLIDRSGCKEGAMSSAGIQEIAACDRLALEVNPNLIIAHIAPTDLQYGLTRMWEAHVGYNKFSIKIFRDRKNAEAWIKSMLTN